LIGQKTFVGIGSAVAQGITIGDSCIIGAGAAVVSDIPSNSLAVGVPAKVKKSTM
jgi:acetyltransferase-like isoleucine patch superfamily enzyme